MPQQSFRRAAAGVTTAALVAAVLSAGFLPASTAYANQATPTTADALIAGDSGNAATHWPLTITEVQGDNPDVDTWEYLEVTNTTDQAIDLDAAGIDIRYHTSQWNTGTVQPVIHLAGEDDAPTVIPAGGVALFWMNYAEGDPRRDLTKDEFRTYYGIDADVPVFRFGNQGGFANSGNRGFSLTDGTGATITRAWVSTDDGNGSTPWNAQFAVPNETDSVDTRLTEFDKTGATAQPTPGSITLDQVTSALTAPVEPTDPPTDPTDPPTDPAAGPGAAGNAGAHWPVVITEIQGDNAGADNWEYIEVTNTTTSPIDLTADGIDVRYHTSQWNAGTVQPLIHLEGENDAPAVIPAGGVAVFWLNYAEGDPRRAFTKTQFRDFYGMTADVPVFRFGNQPGISNGGNRGFSLTAADGTILTRAWVPTDDGVSSTPWNAQFSVPDVLGNVDARLTEYDVTGATAQPTPGAITLAQVTSALTTPTDPEGRGPILQITEVAPDTDNVGGSDAFEFIELYNASDAPVDFANYVINYLSTDNDLINPKALSSTLWPAGASDVIIQPGKTLVLWIQNPAVISAGYTAANFNAKFGTNLVLGQDLLTIESGGMANGGSRGLQLMTQTGYDISRAYYFADDQTTPSTAIQYGWNPATLAPMWKPQDPAGTTQTMIGLGAQTPGTVTKDQVASAFVPYPAPGTAPVITDLAGSPEMPDTDDINLGFDITDDVLVRRVTLTLTDNLGGTDVRNLAYTSPGRYSHAISEVDTFGKRWLEYTVTASDGDQVSTLGPVRIALDDTAIDPVRLNLTDGDFVGGTTTVVATTENNPGQLALSIDGTPVTDHRASLEQAPRFAIEATATDSFFRNGIKLGDEVLRIFDEGYYERIVTVDAEVPFSAVTKGNQVTIGVYAGTKAWPVPDLKENNDDFAFMNPRLVLPDGRVLLPTSCEGAGEGKPTTTRACPTSPSQRISMSDANQVFFLTTFTIPDDAFDSIATLWDTTTATDGAHTVTASLDPNARAAGDESVSRTVIVDNTAPEINTPMVDGRLYRGEFTIDASATDAASGLESISATLNGEAITLPFTTSSLELDPRTHVLGITAIDTVGNQSTVTVNFTTPDETPSTELVSPANGAQLASGDVELSAKPVSLVDDKLDVCFVAGSTHAAGDPAVTVAAGTTTYSGALDRSGATPLTADELEKLAGADGIDVAVTSETQLPYQLFTVDVPTDAGVGADVRVAWDGSANAGGKVLLYVLTDANTWEETDRHVTVGDAPTEFTLEAQVPIAGHAVAGKVTFLVQHSEGWAATASTTRESDVVPFHDDATPRKQYDFTFAWESDTQYYNRNEGNLAGSGGSDIWYQHQLNIHDFLLAERENLNLQYLLHTGDIVDNWDQPHQWSNADAAYAKLDDAGVPYGVLAGNHDVGHFEGNYSEYQTYFGAARFNQNPWYGGSYKDNRGHFDLVSADGVDLLMMYMGWPDPNNEVSNSEDIAWMNSVIQQYPERKVMLNFHEYMLTTGGLGPFPQRILDEVIAVNPNVIAVGSGHYHDAYTRLDEFDDNGDGVADRTVTSMLFDYQGLPEGGLGYMRLLHFDNEGERIIVRTYSPSLDVFNSPDASLNDPAGMQEFEIPYSAGGLQSITKTLATDAFRADVLTAQEIGCADDVRSGEIASVTWSDLAPGEYGWFVHTTGPFGGIEFSEVRTFTVLGDDNGGGDNGGGDNGGGSGDGGNGSGTGSGSGSDANGDTTDDNLANTGGQSMIPLGILALVMLAGGAAMISMRRRIDAA